MENTIINFPLVENSANDPVLERALYLAELDMIELTATVPMVEAAPVEDAKVVF